MMFLKDTHDHTKKYIKGLVISLGIKTRLSKIPLFGDIFF